MGIVLDSSLIIAAERRGHTVREILEQVKASQGETEIGLSVVTIAELVHGAYRTKSETQQQGRLEFIERLSSDVPVYPVTIDVARLAGRIEGEQEAMGIQFGQQNDRTPMNDDASVHQEKTAGPADFGTAWAKRHKAPRVPRTPGTASEGNAPTGTTE